MSDFTEVRNPAVTHGKRYFITDSQGGNVEHRGIDADQYPRRMI